MKDSRYATTLYLDMKYFPDGPFSTFKSFLLNHKPHVPAHVLDNQVVISRDAKAEPGVGRGSETDRDRWKSRRPIVFTVTNRCRPSKVA